MASGNCIVSFGCNDERYRSGLNRLRKTLTQVEWTGGFNGSYQDSYPKHSSFPYSFKTDILDRERLNYKDLLWLDTSMYTIKNPEPLFSRVDEAGFYVSESGFNCAQSVSDKCLELFEITRDEAEGIKEVSSGCVGLNMETDIGKDILRLWRLYTELGGTKGSRQHDNQSSDPRFLFHRQDQSVLSLVLHKLGLKPSGMGEYWDYMTDRDIQVKREIKETVCFICRGL